MPKKKNETEEDKKARLEQEAAELWEDGSSALAPVRRGQSVRHRGKNRNKNRG